MAGVDGFEPPPQASKTCMLPLHHTPMEEREGFEPPKLIRLSSFQDYRNKPDSTISPYGSWGETRTHNLSVNSRLLTAN